MPEFGEMPPSKKKEYSNEEIRAVLLPEEQDEFNDLGNALEHAPTYEDGTFQNPEDEVIEEDFERLKQKGKDILDKKA